MPAEDGQRTFSIIPDRIGPIGHDSASGVPRPMTSKQARKDYLKRTRGTSLSWIEQKRLQAEIRNDIKKKESDERKERDRERARARAEALREKQKGKDEAEKSAKRKAGVPLKPPRPSQATIASFVRGAAPKRKRDDAEKRIDLSQPGSRVTLKNNPSKLDLEHSPRARGLAAVDKVDGGSQLRTLQPDDPLHETKPAETVSRSQAEKLPVPTSDCTLQGPSSNAASNATCQKKDEGNKKVEMGPPPLPAKPSRKKRKLPFLMPGQAYSRPKTTPGPKSTVKQGPSRLPSSPSPARKFRSPRHSENKTFDIATGAQRFLRATQAEERTGNGSRPRDDAPELVTRAIQLDREVDGGSTFPQQPDVPCRKSQHASVQPETPHPPNLCDDMSFDGFEDDLLSGTQLALELSELDGPMNKAHGDRTPLALEDLFPFFSTQDCSLSAEDLADIETPSRLPPVPLKGDARTLPVTELGLHLRPHPFEDPPAKGRHPEQPKPQAVIACVGGSKKYRARDPRHPNSPAHRKASNSTKTSSIPSSNNSRNALSSCPGQSRKSQCSLTVSVSSDDLRALYSADWGDELEIDPPTKENHLAPGAEQENIQSHGRVEPSHCIVSTQDMRVLHSFDWDSGLD